MPLISIIVPVYNAEQYISRCVDSILAQKFSDFELILVNDGSTDGSLAICRSYLDKDSRVIVCNQTNGGASSARNHGIDVSKGEYICFADADDYVNEYYLEYLIRDLLSNQENDLVMHGMIQIKGDKSIPISFKETKNHILDDGSFFKAINLFKFCGPCCKLFKYDIISKNGIRFSEKIIYSEDFDFFAKYLMHCGNVQVSDVKNYFYVAHEDSVSTRIYAFDQEMSGLKRLEISLQNLYERYKAPELDAQIKKFIAMYVSRVLSSIYEPPRESFFNRLKKMKSIEKRFVQIYETYFEETPFKTRVLKFLYVNKCYVLFDMACLIWRWKKEKASKN